MTQERRDAPRVHMSAKVRVETTRGIRRFTSFNLSSGGMYLETDMVLPIGSQISLTFDMPGAGKVVAQGVVKHHRPLVFTEAGSAEARINGMGIAFVRIEGEGAQKLADEIKALSLKTR